MPALPIRAVALDVDGTLARADHRVSARTTRTLAQLQQQGVLPIIITGRMETAALSIARAAALTAPVISCNGAIVTAPETGTRIREVTFSVSTVRAIVAFAHAHRLQPVLWTATQMFTTRRGPVADLLAVINSEPVTVATLPDDDVIKVMLGGPTEHLDDIATDLTLEFPFIQRSLDGFFEASAPGAGKWTALSGVLQDVGIDPAACLGVGDGDIDLEWLSHVGRAVAPENGRPAVRAAAHEIIGHHDEDAVAAFLESTFKLGHRPGGQA